MKGPTAPNKYDQHNKGTNKFENPFFPPTRSADFQKFKEGTARNTQMAPREVKTPPGDMSQGCAGHYQGPKPCRKRGRAKKLSYAPSLILKENHPEYVIPPILIVPTKHALLRYSWERAKSLPPRNDLPAFPLLAFLRETLFMRREITIK